MRRRFAAVLSWETVIMGFIWPRKYGICITSKFIADWADHKQLGETQQDETFLIQFTGDISCLTLKKKKKMGEGGGGVNFSRNYPCKARLLYAQVGKTTAFRGMYSKTSNKRSQKRTICFVFFYVREMMVNFVIRRKSTKMRAWSAWEQGKRDLTAREKWEREWGMENVILRLFPLPPP